MAAINFSSNDEYYTPKEVVDYFGSFDYDPATTKEQAEHLGIPNYDTKETDGLKRDWTHFSHIWCNPPFAKGAKFDFLQKAVDTLEQNVGIQIYFLLPITAIATKRFHKIMEGVEYTLYLPDGRVKFDDGSGRPSSPAFASVVLRLGRSPFERGMWQRKIEHWRLDA